MNYSNATSSKPMQGSGGTKNATWLMKLLLMLSLVLTSGCVSVKYENANDLIKAHPDGFHDAVHASPEAEEFVRECLYTIVELEEKLEGL